MLLLAVLMMFAFVACDNISDSKNPATDVDKTEEEKHTEYVSLLESKYAELETKMNELTDAHDALKIEHEALVAFKANVDKKEKEALIKSFYMLSEDLKKDVVENIDSYSLDDIEAKLSILCVRHKVSFDLDNNTTVEEPTTYSLDVPTVDNTPEWVKAIQNHVAEN